MSPFGYNETVAQEYYPLSRDSVIARNESVSVTNDVAIQVPETLDRFVPRDDGTTETFLH